MGLANMSNTVKGVVKQPELLPQTPGEKLAIMKEKQEFTPKIPKEHFVLALLNQIPFVAKLFDNLTESGKSLTSLRASAGHLKAQHWGPALQIVSTALTLVDFIRIPLIFIAATILGKKPPLTLSKGLEWMYAGTILGLSLTALLFPPSAVPIALTLGSMILATSIYTLGKHAWDWYKTKKDLNKIALDIKEETATLNDLQTKAETFASDTEALPDIDIEELFTSFLSTKEKLQELHNTKAERERVNASISWGTTLDKGLGLVFATAGLIGIALSIAFPPVGLIILGVTAATGLTYGLARGMQLGISFILNATKKKEIKNSPTMAVSDNDDILDKIPDDLLNELAHTETVAPVPSKHIEPSHVDDKKLDNPSDNSLDELAHTEILAQASSKLIAQALFGNDAQKKLEEQLKEDETLDKIEYYLSELVAHPELTRMVNTLNEIDTFISERGASQEEIAFFFDQRNDFKAVVPKLNGLLKETQKLQINEKRPTNPALIAVLEKIGFTELSQQPMEVEPLENTPTPETPFISLSNSEELVIEEDREGDGEAKEEEETEREGEGGSLHP